jgi:alpha-mannosidase
VELAKEFLLREIELLATLATINASNDGYMYPKKEIDDMSDLRLLRLLFA